MKLRRALEKAKMERKGSDRPGRHDLPASHHESGGRASWPSPVYTRSKSVPVSARQVEENRCICIQPEAPEIDAYKVLRTQVQQRTRAQGWRTVMITSVGPGEGKTLTAVNLAIAMARDFHQTVLLVDSDLKQQRIHQYLCFESQSGLGDYLLDDTPLSDLIVWPGIEKLTVISGGSTIRESTELLGSPKMKELVREMKSRYEDRYILFDVPPLLGGADAIAFAPQVDCILVTVESGRTSMADIKKALSLVPGEKLLGLILNRHPAGS